ncbi:hypothetical protein V1512DRAFT_285660 [Lipomyces arxii]|uniref:uncharacterized protein n=1 Tax=Lipomyces arxii TaxID=56418 RepID=UPI0034CFCCD3
MAEASRGKKEEQEQNRRRRRRRPRALSFPIAPADLYQPHSVYTSMTSLASYFSNAGPSTPGGDGASIMSYGSGGRRITTGGLGDMLSLYRGGYEHHDYEEENEDEDEYDDNEEVFDDTGTSSTSSYAGSGAETDPEEEDFVASEYVTDKILQAFDAMLLDTAVVVQAQSSGLLNAKARELQQLQQAAADRISGTRANFAEGMKVLRDVQKDLKWVQNHVDALKRKMSAKYPVEYNRAREMIPEIIEHEDD